MTERSPHTCPDVIVIAAGAAGLAAARELNAKDSNVIVLEARDRVGGRMHTVHDAASPDPIELGAEFVHGCAPQLEALARDESLRILDITGRQTASARREFEIVKEK